MIPADESGFPSGFVPFCLPSSTLSNVKYSTPTRLLDTCTGEFIAFSNSSASPPYAILSHVWNTDGEQSYSDTREIQMSVRRARQESQDQLHGEDAQNGGIFSCLNHPDMSEKIRRACSVARAHGYQLIWIDSCCIDKTSSTELSEAINSMFSWYQNASICYAFLADVSSDQSPHPPSSEFHRSKWFTRGWTLQELIAPRALLFLAKDWVIIGTRHSLTDEVERITVIDGSVLNHATPLRDVSIARRMSWASSRSTTRVEDEAYSLMGIFDINMPTLYGEGPRAFTRLQEEILKRIPDDSIFAWGPHASLSEGFLRPAASPPSSSHSRITQYIPPETSFLAPSPADFVRCSDIHAISHAQLAHRLQFRAGLPIPDYTTSPHGLQAHIPLFPCDHLVSPMPVHSYLAFLACERLDGCLFAVTCYTMDGDGYSTNFILHSAVYASYNARLIVLSPDDVQRIAWSVHLHRVYLDCSLRPQPSFVPTLTGRTPWRTPVTQPPSVALAPWSQNALRRDGYTIYRCDDASIDPSCVLILCNVKEQEYIKIEIDSHSLSQHVLDNWPDIELPTIGIADIDGLRLRTTVWATGYRDIEDVEYCGAAGRGELVRSSGIAGVCTVTLTPLRGVGGGLLEITVD